MILDWVTWITDLENPNAEELYSPSLEYWMCGCPSFVKSSLLCKHLISRYRKRSPYIQRAFGAHTHFKSCQSVTPYVQFRPNFEYPFSMIHLPPNVLAPPTTLHSVRSTSPNTQTHPEQQQHINAAGNDRWEAQVAAKAMVHQAGQGLGGAYNIYRSASNEEQTQVINHSINTNRIDEYIDVVDTYRGLRAQPTIWTDNHPYTRYL
ncbi:hypothetical protein BDC45DRAFT_3748 [Circinella umbellata]|nr:hypothetical protein BDC45DRAFT_3748 [Circinella umbellata]